MFSFFLLLFTAHAVFSPISYALDSSPFFLDICFFYPKIRFAVAALPYITVARFPFECGRSAILSLEMKTSFFPGAPLPAQSLGLGLFL